MRSILAVFTLLLGVTIILAGSGLLGTLLGVRGQIEGMASGTLGIVMSGYFIGYVAGTFLVPKMIRRVGHVRTFAALASLASIATLVHGLYRQPTGLVPDAVSRWGLRRGSVYRNRKLAERTDLE